MTTKFDIFKNLFTNQYGFDTCKEDIAKLLRQTKSIHIKKGSNLDLDTLSKNYPIAYIVEGQFSITFKNNKIISIKSKDPFLIGETSYIRLITGESLITRFGKVLAETDLEIFLIDLDTVLNNNISKDMQDIMVDNITISIINKIIVMNSILEKYSELNQQLILLFTEESLHAPTNFIEKFKKIASRKVDKKTPHISKNIENSNYFNTTNLSDFLSNKKEDILKKFSYLKRYILPKIESLSKLNDNLIFLIAKYGQWLKIRQGETIIYERSLSDGFFYIVVTGKVNILRNNLKINQLSGTFLIGEISLIKQIKGENIIRTATVVADHDTILIKVNIDYITKFNKELSLSFHKSIIMQMKERLINTNEEIIKNKFTLQKLLEDLNINQKYSESFIQTLKDIIRNSENIDI